MVLNKQAHNGISPISCSPSERSSAVPAHKTSQASKKRQSARHSINNMTQVDSCIKSALLVRCIHVSMVLNKQANSGMMSTLCCQ
jgi:hypothetical protein